MINSVLEYEKMASTEDRLWWYKALHFLVLTIVKKKDHPEILDLGCGTGRLLELLKEKGYTGEGIDISEAAIGYCKKKDLTVTQGDYLELDALIGTKKFDVIISNDSLYFFSSQQTDAILSQIHAHLKPEGVLIINYPALKIFKGIHDLAVGIDSRKSKKEVTTFLERNDFAVTEARYWPFFVSPLIFSVRFMQRLKMKMQKNSKISSDVHLPPAPLNHLLYYITKIEFFLKFNPWGSSVFVVASKKSDI